MEEPDCRFLVVDDYDPWRRFVCLTLGKRAGSLVVGEAADGLEAVYKAQELQPDLIFLDVGLPRLNGIQAAKKIRELSPKSKILFVSENASWDIAEAALNTGANGYVLKSAAASDLLRAVDAILRGGRFVSASVSGQKFAHSTNTGTVGFTTPNATKDRRHTVEFFTDDAALVDGFARFIEAAVNQGSAVTFIATESHQSELLRRLKADGFDAETLMRQGRCTFLDVLETLRTVMGADDLPDSTRYAKLLGQLVASLADTTQNPRTAACGEIAPFLLSEGKVEAAIQIEHQTDEFVREHDIDVFCGYLSGGLPLPDSISIFKRISLEHSVHAA